MSRLLGFLTVLGCLIVMVGCGKKPAAEPAKATTKETTEGSTKETPQGAVKVCVSSADVKAIVQQVGGDAVKVTGFVKGPDDPHVVQATPAMIEALAAADLLVIVGLGLEEQWLPTMLKQAGNAKVGVGADGYLELAGNMRTVAGPDGGGVPSSFHPEDNPHFLTDPVEGVKAGRAIADKLKAMQPDHAKSIEQRFTDFANEVMAAYFGADVAKAHTWKEFEPLAIKHEHRQLSDHLAKHGNALGGWAAKLDPHRDAQVVGDHDLWPYFARRYGVRVLGYMEPSPGQDPTTPHLEKLVASMKEKSCRVILSVQYFNPRHAEFLIERTGATVAPLANQPGGRPGTERYVDFVNYNAEQLLKALSSGKQGE